MSQQSVIHIATVDPEDDWKQGILGWLSRGRVLVGWLASNVGAGAVLHWWQTHPVIWISIPASCGFAGGMCLWMLRTTRLHRTRSDHHLHTLCHNLRDHAACVLGDGKQSNGKQALFSKLNNEIAQDIADYFRLLTGDSTVTCAIRLAFECENGDREYITMGRSKGMEAIRESRSKPIPADEGLPGKLCSAQYHGVLMIASIKKAIETLEYFKTPNDDLPDCKSAIVCPINGWGDGTKEMVGILSVTSRNLGGFSQWHTTSMKAIADLLGLVYPILLARLSTTRRAGGTTSMPKAKKPVRRPSK